MSLWKTGNYIQYAQGYVIARRLVNLGIWTELLKNTLLYTRALTRVVIFPQIFLQRTC